MKLISFAAMFTLGLLKTIFASTCTTQSTFSKQLCAMKVLFLTIYILSKVSAIKYYNFEASGSASTSFSATLTSSTPPLKKKFQPWKITKTTEK